MYAIRSYYDDTINTVTVDLSAQPTTTTEGNNQITYTASLTGGVANNDIKVVLANGEEIIIDAGDSTGSITIDVQGDDPYLDGEIITNSITSAIEIDGLGDPIGSGTAGSLENLALASDTSVSVTVGDTEDTTTLTLNDVIVSEGVGTATIGGSLDNVPQTELVVTLSNGATITFGTSYTAGTIVITSYSIHYTKLYE